MDYFAFINYLILYKDVCFKSFGVLSGFSTQNHAESCDNYVNKSILNPDCVNFCKFCEFGPIQTCQEDISLLPFLPRSLFFFQKRIFIFSKPNLSFVQKEDKSLLLCLAHYFFTRTCISFSKMNLSVGATLCV